MPFWLFARLSAASAVMSALVTVPGWLGLGPGSSVRALAADSQPEQTPTPELSPQNPGPHGYFEWTTSAGQTVRGTVTITNPSSTPATFDVYSADAMTASGGGVIYSALGGSLHDIGRWVHIDTGTITLDAGQSRPIGFTVMVPTGAPPGDYLAGVAAQTASAAPPSGERATNGTENGAPNGKSSGVSPPAATRVVLAVLAHVPGPGSVSFHLGVPTIVTGGKSGPVVHIPIDDTGSLLSKPYVTSTLRRCDSKAPVSELGRQLDTFVPHTSIAYQWAIGHRIASGCYHLAAAIYTGASVLSRVTANATVAPAANSRGSALPAGHVGTGGPPAWIVALDSLLLLAVGSGGVALSLGRRRRTVKQ